MPTNYKEILVPVDGSKNSQDALEEGIKIAEMNSANLTVLFVRDKTSTSENPYEAELAYEDLGEEEKIIMNTSNELIKNHDNTSSKILVGYTKPAIIKYAKEINSDLIIMGATGKHSFEKLLLGSVTSYVLNHSNCNVLVVK
ncbi:MULTISPECIES: universal stress protein [Enterococcus]|uniref:universal stress protein n=1 Tax=Enterococcus sp. AZ103 TaxID=2774628 RepID=UPI003F242F9A